jgi:serine/threonine-protein kinase SRPK3
MSEYSYDYNSYDSYESSGENAVDVDFTGNVAENNYVMIMKIGHGAYATVWLCFDIKNNNFVAIKVQSADEMVSGIKEVIVLKKINQLKSDKFNNMITDFKWKINDCTHICMVFELLAGSAYDIIKFDTDTRGLPMNVVKEIIKQILEAMDILNNKLGLLHTDIKPENILIEGKSNKVENIINQFNKLDFFKIVKKYNNKNKKQRKNKGSVYDKAAHEIVGKLDFKNCDNKSRIDDKYFLNNIKVRLSDFGSCCDITNLTDNNIQTRYYMAPEIILESEFNRSCDTWSIGCSAYELLTGKILFDPAKTKRFNRDRHHIHAIQSTIGLIPESVLNKSKKRKVFFKNNGLIKGSHNIEYSPLSKLLTNNIDNIDKINKSLILSFLYNTLIIDPTIRIKTSPHDLLTHEWLK